MTTNNPAAQSEAIGDYACNFCDWKSTDTSRPLSRGLKVGCPACDRDARYVGSRVAQPDGVAEAELEPCPLCDSTNLLLRDIAGWELDCLGCELSLVLADDPSRKGLIERWNTRATPDSIAEKAARVTRKIINALPYEVAQHVNRQLLTTMITTEFGAGGESVGKKGTETE